MDTDRTDLGGNVPLFPFPEGWYFVASRKSILKAGLIQKTWLGQNIVAWCGVEGPSAWRRRFAPTSEPT